MATERRSATWGGIPMKHISLVTLTFQNSGLILIMHYSRIMPLVDGQRYFTSTAVLLNEVIKLGISLTMALYDISSNTAPPATAMTLFKTLIASVFTGDSWKLAIPAMLYTLQNSLQYVAVSNLSPAVFQVTYQLKILTTAVFTVMLLRRSLSARKWTALVLLTIGVAIVQLPSGSTPPPPPTMETLKDEQSEYNHPRSLEELMALGNFAAKQLLSKRSATYEGIHQDQGISPTDHSNGMNASIGLTAVIVACMLSGLAGVYFEKVLKDSGAPVSLWIRNIQLAFYSLFPALFIGVVFKDGADIAKAGFFAGYNGVVWAAILMQAFGGIVVALVVNYADNIAKNFATSISILISFVASYFIFDLQITTGNIVGTVVVLGATYLYTHQEHARAPPITIAEYEKTTVDNDPSYFDGTKDGTSTLLKSPLLGDARTTSRPGTPTRAGSERRSFGKRDDSFFAAESPLLLSSSFADFEKF
ncbi:nucleotide-sugar transporter [Patellaria atrata CBS 101060]|uniref:Nucleotide-sugar transporter n=1 Tax=Patellaria atrata CBS 101060 TaxID=1346257 RepID=A0A9P4SFZ5_9PEZI|nr:nucleotide-sugar transporter [Patellaria atrata CBS 101060]